MGKAIITSVISIVLGYLGSAIGYETMNWPQLGPILATVVMGSVIIYSLGKINNGIVNSQFDELRLNLKTGNRCALMFHALSESVQNRLRELLPERWDKNGIDEIN